MRRPGIVPGSTAWKAAMLTTIPPTLTYHVENLALIHFIIFQKTIFQLTTSIYVWFGTMACCPRRTEAYQECGQAKWAPSVMYSMPPPARLNVQSTERAGFLAMSFMLFVHRTWFVSRLCFNSQIIYVQKFDWKISIYFINWTNKSMHTVLTTV
jgi:hypothetical protein